jgi:hypothetical protein
MAQQQYEISPRVALQAATRPYLRERGVPLVRPLRIYTLDPSVSRRVGGIATVEVPYEKLEEGPKGALFELDPAGAPAPLVARSLDLDDHYLLMSAGLAPSPADARFHMQMVYAVCSLTYAAFRRAMGRDVAWACGVPAGPDGALRLRVRPFAFEDDNASYDRGDNGLAFGYFRAGPRPGGHTVPNGLTFTSLSHDVIAHETTHALLDALRSHFYEPVDPDVLGFHEGFADLVALLLHFTYKDVLQEALKESRGALTHAALLTGLAREFGLARGTEGKSVSAMRSAVDVEGILAFDSDALVGRGKEGPREYGPGMEAHALGSVLVSAVFEAFATLFRRKTERLLRIAGVSPDKLGSIEPTPDLVSALAGIAREIASSFLNVCIRAIDYCPPVGLEIGEYLRALITADAEVVPDDEWCYREAFMRSFRRRGLFPRGVCFMTEDAVKWDSPAADIEIPDLAFDKLRFVGEPGRAAGRRELERQAHALGRFVCEKKNAEALGLVAPGAPLPKGMDYVAPPRIESIRCARRVSPDRAIVFDLIAEVIQGGTVRRGRDLFDFQGGCTLVVDPYGRVRYAVNKRADSEERQDRQHAAMKGPLAAFWTRKRGRRVPSTGLLRAVHGRR